MRVSSISGQHRPFAYCRKKESGFVNVGVGQFPGRFVDFGAAKENGHFRFDTIISFNRQVEEEQIKRLRESIWNAVADGQITDQELEYINSFYFGSELSQEDFEKLRAEIFTQVVQQAIADRRIVEGELNSIKANPVMYGTTASSLNPKEGLG